MLSSDLTSENAAPEDLESDKDTSSNSRLESDKYIRIKDDADLILDVEVSSGDERVLYLVMTAALRDSSLYFRNLLDPGKFSEGARVSAVQKTLRDRYRSWQDSPPHELPRISITDIGQLSSHAQPEESMASFLRVLHGVHPPTHQPTPSWLANLVVVADRFDGLNSIRALVGKHYSLYNAMTTRWLHSAYKEEPTRQTLLSGMLLNLPQWVSSCSARLVNHGSHRWDAVTEVVDQEPRAMWWALPNGVEGTSIPTCYMKFED